MFATDENMAAVLTMRLEDCVPEHIIVGCIVEEGVVVGSAFRFILAWLDTISSYLGIGNQAAHLGLGREAHEGGGSGGLFRRGNHCLPIGQWRVK